MTDHVPTAVRPSRSPLALGSALAWAKRRSRQHPVLIAAAVVVVAGGGAAWAAVALTSATAVQPAGPCPVTAGGYYAYAIPDDPAHPPSAGSGATSWGWTPRKHQVKVGDRMRVNGRLWQVTEIAAMPGVEPVGRPFSILGWQPPLNKRGSGTASLTFCGRLVFGPVS
jgi:hypothetical protein